jgi:hypothetical protein
MTAESIEWTPVADETPDSDQTVLLFDAKATEPVWAGFWDDGVEAWFYVTGGDAEPTHWAEFPEGPKP